MRLEVRWLWRIKWCGKWGTTNHHATEDHIRREHPEAIRVEGSRIEQYMPVTQAECQDCMFTTTGDWLNKAK